MASKMLEGKRADVARLRATADRIIPELDSGLSDRLGRFVEEGESLGGVALLATVAVRGIESLLEELESAEADHDAVQAALEERRWLRVVATRRLRDALSPIQKMDRALYRNAPRKQLPVQPNALLRHMIWLRRPRPAALEQVVDGVEVDFEAMVATADSAAEALRAALVEVEEGMVEAKLAQLAKHDAVARFNAEYGPCVRLLKEFAALAGKPELAVG